MFDDLACRINLSTSSTFRTARDAARTARNFVKDQPDGRMLARVRAALDKKPDALLISAYLQHFRTVQEIGKLCHDRNIPFLLGGPMFNIQATADAWRRTLGLLAILGAEADHSVNGILEALVSGGNLLQYPGVMLPDGRRSAAAPPLRNLDDESRVPVVEMRVLQRHRLCLRS